MHHTLISTVVILKLIKSNPNTYFYKSFHWLKGHYREARYSQTKHHWWWKANFVFGKMRILQNFEGMIICRKNCLNLKKNKKCEFCRPSRFPRRGSFCCGRFSAYPMVRTATSERLPRSSYPFTWILSQSVQSSRSIGNGVISLWLFNFIT